MGHCLICWKIGLGLYLGVMFAEQVLGLGFGFMDRTLIQLYPVSSLSFDHSSKQSDSPSGKITPASLLLH